MDNTWYKLDNVAKVFLADHSVRNPQTLRVSCTLTEEVKPGLLQAALDETIILRPQVQVRVRRGFFWHYIERSNVQPVVSEESGRPCPTLYGNGHNGYLHYKVTYYGNRINLDIFHAIVDGTGALNFLELLVLNYLKLAHPGELDEISQKGNASRDERFQNSFDHFYDDSNGPIPNTILSEKKKAYKLTHKLPYDQLRFIEVHMPAQPVINAAKECGVSLTSYLGAQLMLALRAGMPFGQRHKPICISMPVNLRNYYPSETMRNFFNNVDVAHVFDGSETLESLATEFNTKLKASLEPSVINDQMNRYQSIEKLFFTRMVPLAIKQPVVKFFSRKEKKRVTAVLSNLGVIKYPEEMSKYISGITDYCTTESMFITATSYNGELVLGITQSYTDVSVVKRLISALQETGAEVYACFSDVIE